MPRAFGGLIWSIQDKINAIPRSCRTTTRDDQFQTDDRIAFGFAGISSVTLRHIYPSCGLNDHESLVAQGDARIGPRSA